MFRQKFPYQQEVHSLAFYVKGDEEIINDSQVSVTSEGLFKGEFPIEGGVYDPHMGTTDHSWTCASCGNIKKVCPGHPGSIDLLYPVKNPLFRDQLLKWLKVVCFNCGELVTEKVVKAPPEKLLSEYVKHSKSAKFCKKCKEFHPTVSKDKIEPEHFYAEYAKSQQATRIFPTAKKPAPKRFLLYNHIIQKIVNKISDKTVQRLGKPLRSHPKKFILTTIKVAPNTIRPDIRRIGGNRSNNSDITALTKNIIEMNESLPSTVPEYDNISKELTDAYFNLSMGYYELVKGSSTSNNQVRMATNTNKAPASIASRIPKKRGRMRKNIMGRRVKYMIRSVITGDPSLKIDEIGIPLSVAKEITIPEVVRPYNRDRLQVYFQNKDVYPGCIEIQKALDGKTYLIECLDPEYILQDGDIIHRHLINGDQVAFNRQPSLTWTSISCHKVVILERADTLRLNVSACNLYNADFDGDAMSAIIARNIMSRNEISMQSSVANWFISYKHSAPMIGVFQDSLIGTSRLTKKGVSMNKWHAMNMFAQINKTGKDMNFTQDHYTNRDVVSMLLPNINFSGKKPKMYMKEYAPFIKYDPEDIDVQIKRGKLISGVLDKSSVGQESKGSIFHIINNEYGAQKALDVIYNFQQMTTRFFLYKGFTTGMRDILISDSAKKRIKQNVATMIQESRRNTKKLNRGDMVAPIGMSLEEFYENMQLNILQPGDEFVVPVLNDMNLDTNKQAQLVMSGSKGKIQNIIAINAALGNQLINSKRADRQFGWGRTSPYFLRYDTEPKSLGYVSDSFREGVKVDVYPFAAGEARHGLINNALKTSVTGHQNRVSIKNLESIRVNNLRQSAKTQNLVQPLYAESGVDPRKTETIKLPTMSISDVEMKTKYKADVKNFDKIYNNSTVKKILEEEFDDLMEDRKFFRRIMLELESSYPGQISFHNTFQMPINVYRIIEDVVFNFQDEIKKLPSSKKRLDPVLTIKKTRDLCVNIDYGYFNSVQEKNKMKIPEHIKIATTFVKMLIRSHLCTRHLLSRGITDDLLDIIISKVKITFQRSLMDYGMAVGIIAAQAISEPMTQFVLDSKHRSGISGSKTNPIVRIKEVVGCTPTEKMKNPSMLLAVKPEFETNKVKVQEIANHIEMMKFNRFINSTCIFFEKFGNPVHPRFKHEKDFIAKFQKHNIGGNKPSDLSNWCIRFELDKEEMIINSMRLETIVRRLRRLYPDIYFVYTPENSQNVVIRCYLRAGMIKQSASSTEEETVVLDTMPKIKNSVIRGVRGIVSTVVINTIKTVIDKDGGLKKEKIFMIDTMGTNLEAAMRNPFIDSSRSQTDSILDFEKMFGIEATRNKIIYELRKAADAINPVHATIYGDEMTYSGQVTSIQRTGMQKREMSNVTLRLSFQSPIQVIEDAAVHGLVDRIGGLSGPLVVGSTPKYGTMYNQVIVNDDFLMEHAKKTSKEIDDEL